MESRALEGDRLISDDGTVLYMHTWPVKDQHIRHDG